MTFIEAPS